MTAWPLIFPRKKVKVLVAQSCPTLCDPMTVAHQVLLSMGFPRQEYWNGFPLPSPGDLPDPGIEPRSPALQVDALLSELLGKPSYLTSFFLQREKICFYFLIGR